MRVFRSLILLSTLFAMGLAESGYSSSTYEARPSSYYRQGRQVGYPYSNSYYRYQPSYYGFGNGGGFGGGYGGGYSGGSGYSNFGYRNPYIYQQQGWNPSYQTGYYRSYPYSNYNSYPRYNNYQSGFGYGSGSIDQSYGVVPQPVRSGYAK